MGRRRAGTCRVADRPAPVSRLLPRLPRELPALPMLRSLLATPTPSLLPLLCALLVVTLAGAVVAAPRPALWPVGAPRVLPPAAPAGHAATPWTSRVLCASSEDGRQRAWISARDGLQLEGWPGQTGLLSLGHAGLPRFLPDGRFVFEVGRDDGHRLLGQVVRVLDPGQLRPRAPHRGEDVGRFLPPRLPPPAPGVVRIGLDAGHGGGDTGAVGGTLSESELALQTALALAELLATDSSDTSGGGQWEIVLTRLDDHPLTLLERASMLAAAGVQAVLSLHADAAAETGGVRTLCHGALAPALSLRDRTHARLLQALPLGDRGVGHSDASLLAAFPTQAVQAALGVLGQPDDVALLSGPEAVPALARACLFAVQEVFAGSIHEPSLFQQLGGGTYGSHGKPSLLVAGSLLGRSTLHVSLLDAASDSSAWLLGSTRSLPLALPAGGLLHAWPADVQWLLPTDASGGAGLTLPWPVGVPTGQTLWLQALVVDPFVLPHGFTLTDAWQGITP